MKEFENYQVGALLYSPANHPTLVNSLLSNRFGDKYSMALCLEDTINDEKVREAELAMESSLIALHKARQEGKEFYLPKIFVRVREPEQIRRITKELEDATQIIAGFNLPKFNLENAEGYLRAIDDIVDLKPDVKFMPIIESNDMINIRRRADFLYELKDIVKQYETRIPNVRVGGNDISHLYALRRHVNETIYDLKPVAAALTDILSVFLDEFVVSGPVFEYYSGPYWEQGLKNECAMDVAMGFIGKTAIHPNQVQIINNALKVSSEDYDDAMQILRWNKNAAGVSGSANKSRMNEVKTHTNWAQRIVHMANYYGVQAPNKRTIGLHQVSNP
jgi:citrate lyase beta subunit